MTGAPKRTSGLSPQVSASRCSNEPLLDEDLEAYLKNDMHARTISRVLRVIRIFVDCAGLFLTVPAAFIEIIAICYIWNHNKTVNWAVRHKELIASVGDSLTLFAYFWTLSFSFATFPVLRRRFPPGWKNDLLAIFCLFLVVLPVCAAMEVFSHLVELTSR